MLLFIESSSDSPQARKQEGIDKVASILDKYLGMKCSITNAVRLGKKLQGTKPQLHKITLASIQEKKAVLCRKIHFARKATLKKLRRFSLLLT